MDGAPHLIALTSAWIRRLVGRAFPRYRTAPLEIDADRRGLMVLRPPERSRSAPDIVNHFRWIDVESIHAFKRDQVIVDQVCVAFDVGGRAIEITEDMKGYADLVSRLPEFFPAIDLAGLNGILLPPFATNARELWRRPPPAPPEPPNDRQLAASLWLALHTGMLTPQQVVAFVDREISLRPSPAIWLIDVSLETRVSEVMSRLLCAAEGHPMLDDDLARLDAYGRVPDRDARISRLGGELARFFGSDIPSDVSDEIYELDEAAYCAHETNGVVDEARVDQVLGDLFEAVRRRSPWTAALDRIQAPLQTSPLVFRA